MECPGARSFCPLRRGWLAGKLGSTRGDECGGSAAGNSHGFTLTVKPWLSPTVPPNSSPRVPPHSIALATDPSVAVASRKDQRSQRSSTRHPGRPASPCGSRQDDRALGKAFRGQNHAFARVRNRGRYERYATDSRECCLDPADLSLETPTLEASALSLAERSYQANALRYRWWGRPPTPAGIDRPGEPPRAEVAREIRRIAITTPPVWSPLQSKARRETVWAAGHPGPRNPVGVRDLQPAIGVRVGQVLLRARITLGGRDPRARSSHQVRRDMSALGSGLRRTRERS